jgi:hypothetical protein
MRPIRYPRKVCISLREETAEALDKIATAEDRLPGVLARRLLEAAIAARRAEQRAASAAA